MIMPLGSSFVQNGDVLSVAAPAIVSGGSGALLATGVFGVAMRDLASAEVGPFAMVGVFSLAKNSAEAWTLLVKIYWDNTAKVCTIVATANTYIGNAAAIAVNPSGFGTVRLNGIAI